LIAEYSKEHSTMHRQNSETRKNKAAQTTASPSSGL
jgi:hypothetical protein